MDRVIVRLAVLAAGAGAGLAAAPGLPGRLWWALGGLAVAGAALCLERRTRRVPLPDLFWGAVGALAGILGGSGVGLAVEALAPGAGPAGRGLPVLLLGYLGCSLALARRSELAGLTARLFPEAASDPERPKILDTSAIIDGRVADVCAAGFLEGPLVVPQFVLAELQQIADSPDTLRRNRGKRGFAVLERLQGLPGVRVRVQDRDFPQLREVDRKLLELARALGGAIVTTDYNLQKVAGLSGVPVLNVNELAHALRPVLLPGEPLRLTVLREGKEPGQGVAYLDDGTMVVLEQGRRFVGQPVDAVVTSVLQTTAGRMIFARPAPQEEPAARGGAA